MLLSYFKGGYVALWGKKLIISHQTLYDRIFCDHNQVKQFREQERTLLYGDWLLAKGL